MLYRFGTLISSVLLPNRFFIKTFNRVTIKVATGTKIKLKDIAERAGVAVATVSAALNNTGRIGAEARQRILKIAGDMNYEPNLAAKFLKQKSRTDIGLIVSELPERLIGSGYFQPMVVSFIQQCENQGITCQIEYHNIRQENAVPNLFTRGFVGGIIHGGYINRGIRDWIARHPDFPFVALEEPSEYSISSDFQSVVYQAVRHLVECGHRRIGLLGGPQEYDMQHKIKLGFDRAVREFGVDTHRGEWIALLEMADHADTVADGVNWGRRFLSAADRPTAVVGADARVVRGLFHAVMELGLRVPEDLSLIGNCGPSEAEQFYPQLTSFSWDFEQVMKQGLKMLRALMSGRNLTVKNVVMPPELRERGTVKRL